MPTLKAISFASLALLASPSLLQATPLQIKFYDAAGTQGKLELTAGSHSCEIEYLGSEAYRTCELELPAGTTTIQLSGRFLKEGKKIQGTQSWKVVDLAGMLRKLRDPQRPFGARLREFLRACEAFAQSDPLWAEEQAIYFEQGAPVSRDAVAAAEKRLGFALPPEHVSFLTEMGQLGIDDSSTEKVGGLKNAYKAMIETWGTAKEDLDEELSAKTKKVFEESVLLYTEVGDGYGGLLYRPSGSTHCQGPAYYFVHQDDLNDFLLLKNHDGRCRNYTESMIFLLATQALQRYEEYRGTHAFLDTSAPGVLQLELWGNAEGGKLAFTLEPVWSELE